MSVDLQFLCDTTPAILATPREHAIYRDAESATRITQKARNVADLLERGHRARPSAHPAIIIDLMA